MSFFPIIGAVLFTLVAILTFLVTIGLPLGEFTMGGRFRVVPPKMRIATGISFFIQVFASLIILQVGEIISLGIPQKVAKGICIFFAIYLLINTIMNFCSTSKKEKYVMTPLSLITSICFFVTAFTN